MEEEQLYLQAIAIAQIVRRCRAAERRQGFESHLVGLVPISRSSLLSSRHCRGRGLRRKNYTEPTVEVFQPGSCIMPLAASA